MFTSSTKKPNKEYPYLVNNKTVRSVIELNEIRSGNSTKLFPIQLCRNQPTAFVEVVCKNGQFRRLTHNFKPIQITYFIMLTFFGGVSKKFNENKLLRKDFTLSHKL